MPEIDFIMGLLDWNRPLKTQETGRNLAKAVENIQVFLQPCNQNYNKNVWDNCAQILTEKTDEELSAYLMELMHWLRDLTWPGAVCILNRLQQYEDTSFFRYALRTCLAYAAALDDCVWTQNLKLLETRQELPDA